MMWETRSLGVEELWARRGGAGKYGLCCFLVLRRTGRVHAAARRRNMTGTRSAEAGERVPGWLRVVRDVESRTAGPFDSCGVRLLWRATGVGCDGGVVVVFEAYVCVQISR